CSSDLFFQVPAQGFGDHFAHAQRRTGRRIDFMPVVHFHHFNITVIAHHRGGHAQQIQTEVHTHGIVRRKDNAHVGSCHLHGGFLLVIKASGTDYDLLTMLTAEFNIGHGGRRGGEIDQHIELVNNIGNGGGG